MRRLLWVHINYINFLIPNIQIWSSQTLKSCQYTVFISSKYWNPIDLLQGTIVTFKGWILDNSQKQERMYEERPSISIQSNPFCIWTSICLSQTLETPSFLYNALARLYRETEKAVQQLNHITSRSMPHSNPELDYRISHSSYIYKMSPSVF